MYLINAKGKKGTAKSKDHWLHNLSCELLLPFQIFTVRSIQTICSFSVGVCWQVKQTSSSLLCVQCNTAEHQYHGYEEEDDNEV